MADKSQYGETFRDHVLRSCPICTAPTPKHYTAGRYYASFVAHAKEMGWLESQENK